MTPRFRHFVAIDWSGAAGLRHRGIAVALCTAGSDAPVLVRESQRWSRVGILEWLTHDLPAGTLVGLDLGIALPFVDRGGYFPGWADSPPDARALWQLIDTIAADDPDLGATSFVDHADVARHLRRHGGRKGDLFDGTGRLRITEHAQAAAGLRPYSNLNLVGAAQVGKSSFTGMRLLHRLTGRHPVWPIDPPGATTIVEIYTSLAARVAGRAVGRSKMRSGEELDAGLITIGSAPTGRTGPIDDHRSDALLTAAWLRSVAHDRALWNPTGMTSLVAATEGWTFGIA